MNSELSNIPKKPTIITDQEFKIRVGNRLLTSMYNFCCSNEVINLFMENGWKKLTPERTKMIDELYEEFKPSFINFAHSGPDVSEIDNLPFLFSKHLIFLDRRKKLEKIIKKI